MRRSKPNPTYAKIKDATECLRVEFDPNVISFAQLVERVFDDHDPFEGSSWHPRSRQYQKAFYFLNEQQKQVLESHLDALCKKRKQKRSKVTTVIESATPFYKAEAYHQHYLKNRRRGGL